jgi:glycerate-2-kinase
MERLTTDAMAAAIGSVWFRSSHVQAKVLKSAAAIVLQSTRRGALISLSGAGNDGDRDSAGALVKSSSNTRAPTH